MGEVWVQFLGTGDPFGTGGRFQSCVLIDSERGRYLLDRGATSLVAMRRFGIEPTSIDGVLVSHLHGDHVGGLPFLLLNETIDSDRELGGRRRERPLQIMGPAGTEDSLRQALSAFRYDELVLGDTGSGVGPAEIVTLAPGREVILGPLRVTPFSAVHTPEALAFRVTCDGKTIGYLGDTAWTEALVDVADDADLFICQVYSFDLPQRTMLSYATLREQRDKLTSRRLVLTHIGAEMEQRLDDVVDEVAEDGLRIRL